MQFGAFCRVFTLLISLKYGSIMDCILRPKEKFTASRVAQ